MNKLSGGQEKRLAAEEGLYLAHSNDGRSPVTEESCIDSKRFGLIDLKIRVNCKRWNL